VVVLQQQLQFLPHQIKETYMEKFDTEKRIEWKWAWDSETGEKFLIDMISGQILVRGKDLKDMAFGDKETRMIEDAKMWEQGFNEGYDNAKDDDYMTLCDLEGEILWLKEEMDYLKRLSNNQGDSIQ
jgi:hypothetical protein